MGRARHQRQKTPQLAKTKTRAVVRNRFKAKAATTAKATSAARQQAFAKISAGRHSHGRPISQFDAQIAAIAQTLGAELATRNVTYFEGCGIKLLNPWV